MSRREESSRVAGAVTIPTIATFLSIRPRALAIDTVGIVALGFGLGEWEADGFGLALERGVPAVGSRVGRLDDIGEVAGPEAVAIEGARTRRSLAADADDPIRRADLERSGRDAARRVGHDLDRGLAGRSRMRLRSPLAAFVGRVARRPVTTRRRPSVASPRPPAPTSTGSGRSSTPSVARPPAAGRISSWPYGAAKRSGDHDDRASRWRDRARRESDGDPGGRVADREQLGRPGASGLGGHHAPCRHHGPDRQRPDRGQGRSGPASRRGVGVALVLGEGRRRRARARASPWPRRRWRRRR